MDVEPALESPVAEDGPTSAASRVALVITLPRKFDHGHSVPLAEPTVQAATNRYELEPAHSIVFESHECRSEQIERLSIPELGIGDAPVPQKRARGRGKCFDWRWRFRALLLHSRLTRSCRPPRPCSRNAKWCENGRPNLGNHFGKGCPRTSVANCLLALASVAAGCPSPLPLFVCPTVTDDGVRLVFLSSPVGRRWPSRRPRQPAPAAVSRSRTPSPRFSSRRSDC